MKNLYKRVVEQPLTSVILVVAGIPTGYVLSLLVPWYIVLLLMGIGAWAIYRIWR